ncbi:MAG: hypothetical protein HY840_15775 [Bacteroidetes bacterium]|nr:hypothetical protein [Bacteroidota bacterium]
MNCIFYFLILIFNFSCLTSLYAQKKVEKEKREILGEGIALYTIILANWTSNDLYYENEFSTSGIKGYLSYKDKDTLKTIFWREIDTSSAEYKAKNYRQAADTGVIAEQNLKKISDLRVITKTFSYEKMNVTKKNVNIIEDEREPTTYEIMMMDFRSMAYDEMRKDTAFYTEYQGTALKAVPVDMGKKIKVYIYSASTSEDFVPFGGDYFILYKKKEKELVERKKLHNRIIMISSLYKGKASDASKVTYHKHKGDSPELITPTDIATLLLYKTIIDWDEHHVISDEYTCIFTLIDRKLNVISTKEYEHLNKKKALREKEEKKLSLH